MLIGVIIAIVIIGAAITAPRIGLRAMLIKRRTTNAKVRVEDALKHIHDCEYHKRHITWNDVVRTLGLSVSEGLDLSSTLRSMNLVTSEAGELRLTDEGRMYALRVIRVHRLWERYLADETSVAEKDWHTEAEKREHRLSTKDADALAAQLGNPQFDPHGDPIPTANGEIPEQDALSLVALHPGDIAAIVHLEDEPAEIYAQLAAQRLYPGMQIQVVEVSDQRIRFEAEGEECVLAPLFAENVSVRLLSDAERATEPFIPLSSLKMGEEATVVAISRACRGQQRRRLMDFGVVPGTRIRASLQSLTGDPMAYEIRSATVALRKQHADQVFIRDIHMT
ncbi:MAG: FeoA domain-containing protein [Ignavibacteriales bacterium]|nr:FeoA domain-containing protein [Ignavibacteriales bacterium]